MILYRERKLTLVPSKIDGGGLVRTAVNKWVPYSVCSVF